MGLAYKSYYAILLDSHRTMIRRYRHGGGGGGRSIEEGGVSEDDVEKYEGDNNNKVSTFAPWRTKFLLIRYLKCGFWLGMALWLHSILVYLSQMNDIRYPPLSASATRRTIRQLEREHQIETLAKQRVVVSMATMPGREGVLLETLESLYHQSARPGRVQIHYSHKNKQELYPLAKMKDKVSLMQERYRPKKQSSSPNADEGSNSSNSDEDTNMKITFHLADPQWRSSAKLLGALYLEWNGTSPLHRQQQKQTLQTKEVDAETLLVVADDDVAYESVWLESLLVGHIVMGRHQPGVRVAIGMRGWRLQSSLQWGSPPIRKWGVTNYHGPWGAFSAGERYIIMGAKILQPYQVHVLTHVQGALYRPSFFEGTDIFHSPSDVHKSMDGTILPGYRDWRVVHCVLVFPKSHSLAHTSHFFCYETF